MHEKDTACRPYAAPPPVPGPLSRGALGLFMAHRPGLLEYANDIPENRADAEYVARMA